MPKPRSLAQTCVVLTLLGTTSLSCQRKAPGPDECAHFAEQVVADGEPITPEMRLHIEAETQQCLTRPYDRELLDCVLVTRQARTCLNDFRRRKGRPSEPSAWP